MGQFITRTILCSLPLLATPLLGYLIADSYLNFGGGEKDLFLLVPWVLWSLIYFLIFIALWIKRKNLKVILSYSIGGATIALFLTGIVLYFFFNNVLGVYKG